MQHNTSQRGFTILEMVIVGVLVIILIVILMPAIGTGRPPNLKMTNSSQLRNIHQGMVIYAQSNKPGGSTGRFPGLNLNGTPSQIDVEQRFKLLLDANAFTPADLINPRETAKKIEYRMNSGKPLTADHYSYALLQIPAQGGRHDEWAETVNSQAVVLGDRNTNTSARPESVWSGGGSPWQGTVVYNDNSTSFQTTHVFYTQYGSVATKDDHLFEAAGDDDAYLIHRGN